MLHPALEQILPRVQKPARYVGGEWGSIQKNKEEVDLRIAFCFPDTYEVGMSHLGSRILYGLLNDQEGIWCERVFAPWIDMEREMRDAGIPLYVLESGDPLCDFDIIGFTLQYELSFTNILNMLDLGGVPVRSREREGLKNLVVAGGPCAYNPEPLCDFVDLFMIGDGEEIMLDLTNLYRSARARGLTKHEFLVEAAQIPGMYVPTLYDVSYHEDGTIAAVTPREGAPALVQKRIVKDLDTMYYPDYFVVPSTDIVFDRAMIEIFRGCPRGCRFCQAGHTYRPLRRKSTETLMRQAKAVLENSGYEEISLSSLSTSDYSELSQLTECMLDYCEPRHISLSLPSLRADSFNAELMERVQKVRKSGLTFAAEAGTQRLRDVINKNLTEEDLLSACEIAFKGGWNNVKIYFMIGLPTETSEDLDGIADLCRKVAYCWRVNTDNRARGCRVTASASCFVPKPQTPFQWDAQNTMEMLEGKQDYMKKIMHTKNVVYNWHDAKTSVMEGVIARGDRRQGEAIYTAWKSGCVFDGWDQCFSLEKWYDAFKACGLDPMFYSSRVRPLDELFPWDHIGCGTTKEHLKREWLRSRKAEPTVDCMQKCAGCGANSLLEGGKCCV
ncbi:MAG: TIGR03960 family B12-binding radical SAM protein [Butyricicoccus sp.]